MSDKHINTGGPAFPVADTFACQVGSADELDAVARGMTLRDYFAAKALPAVYLGLCDDVRAFGAAAPEDWDMGVARDAYKLADAMLKAREGE